MKWFLTVGGSERHGSRVRCGEEDGCPSWTQWFLNRPMGGGVGWLIVGLTSGLTTWEHQDLAEEERRAENPLKYVVQGTRRRVFLVLRVKSKTLWFSSLCNSHWAIGARQRNLILLLKEWNGVAKLGALTLWGKAVYCGDLGAAGVPLAFLW